MSTLRDVLDKMTSVQNACLLFGSDVDFGPEYKQRISALGAAIRDELKLLPGETTTLSPETPLGSVSEYLFNDLLDWLTTQHEMFKK